MELLVRILDKVNNDDTKLDAGCAKRGDVISVCPNGWNWTHNELTHDFWMIVKVSDLPESVAETLVMSEVGDKQRYLLRKRWNTLNFQKLPNELNQQFAYPRRSEFVEITSADIQTIREQKEPKPNPFVIEDNPEVVIK